MTADVLASLAAFIITLMVLSYLVGDSPVFRIAVSVFVGVAAGYVAVVAWWQVLLPRLLMPLLAGQGSSGGAILAVPLLLSGLMLMKAWPPISRLGSPALGFLVGVASAVAIGGALQGTLWPQLGATLNGMSLQQSASLEAVINGGIVLVGLIASLVYFQFSARSNKDGSVGQLWIVRLIGVIGGAFLAITLGMLFAGVYSAALTALIERLHFILSYVGLG